MIRSLALLRSLPTQWKCYPVKLLIVCSLFPCRLKVERSNHFTQKVEKFSTSLFMQTVDTSIRHTSIFWYSARFSHNNFFFLCWCFCENLTFLREKEILFYDGRWNRKGFIQCTRSLIFYFFSHHLNNCKQIQNHSCNQINQHNISFY